MAMNLSAGDSDDDELNTSINTTPLVDVMLVLLIIFLITIPVAISAVHLNLPKDVNKPRVSRTQAVVVSIDARGEIYWNDLRLSRGAALPERLRAVAALRPQPQVQVRGDASTPYQDIAAVLDACQRAGIAEVDFLVQPPARD